MGGAAGAVLGAEICAPLLLLCWLCCWPDDANSDVSSGKHPQRPALAHAPEAGARRRSTDVLGRRVGSSAVSLHLPSTSGYRKPLSAHRSHEEIGGRQKSNLDNTDQETRYHSAPSVIDEVLHRRDWERSNKNLHIPLKPEKSVQSPESDSNSGDIPDKVPRESLESSSIEDFKIDESIRKTCKKHHTNIKSSKGRKEKVSSDVKDSDATERPEFYISDNDTHRISNETVSVRTKSISKAKEAKQFLNESIKIKEHPRQGKSVLITLDEGHPNTLGFCLDDVIDQLDSLDRSGAMHHATESRTSAAGRPFPPASVEPVGYEGGACYLAEVGRVSELRARVAGPPPAERVGVRPRHASDGDILAQHLRPESGAFSESDLDLDLEGSEEVPPPYHELQRCPPDRKETAI